MVRESTEGLFASRGKGVVEDDREARDTMVITRKGSERVHEFAFRLARSAAPKRQRHLRRQGERIRSMAFFRKVFDEVARAPSRGRRRATTTSTRPRSTSCASRGSSTCIVTENMFGDILSDQAAALVGGMGMAPSGDIGDEHALFQPCHGSAPDIAGRARPTPPRASSPRR